MPNCVRLESVSTVLVPAVTHIPAIAAGLGEDKLAASSHALPLTVVSVLHGSLSLDSWQKILIAFPQDWLTQSEALFP